MTTLAEIIKSRRSIRSYTKEPVAQEEIEQILEAGIWAPSGKNMQTWQFTVVRDPANLAELSGAIAKAIGANPEVYNFYKPTALIITSNDASNGNGANDNACAMQNMMLMAHSLGLGSVWINQAIHTCNEPEVRKVVAKLGIPDNHNVYGMLALGHMACELPQGPERRGKIVFAD